MKKVLAVIAVAAVVCVAGSAFAQGQQKPRIDPKQPQFAQRPDFAPCFCSRGDNKDIRRDDRPGDSRRDDQRGRPDFAPDMPKEVRAKAVELAKLRIDLEEALTSRPVNKAKALEVHARILDLEKEIEAWKFAQRLDFMEKAKIQRELNKRITRPAPKLPTPAPVPAPKAEVEAEISAEAE